MYAGDLLLRVLSAAKHYKRLGLPGKYVSWPALELANCNHTYESNARVDLVVDICRL